jgi:hypothetical protein
LLRESVFFLALIKKVSYYTGIRFLSGFSS